MGNIKIGIITWLGFGNYGTSLQAYALFQFLKERRYKVYITESIPNSRGLRAIIKYVLQRTGLLSIMNRHYYSHLSIKQQKILAFQRSVFKIPVLTTPLQRRHFVNSTDVFVSGSDQIWNTCYMFNPTMFLDFAKGKRKIAYASSIGTNHIAKSCEGAVRELLLQYDKIGVRESVAVEIISKLTNRQDIVKVLDPTFLLTKEEWNIAFSNSKISVTLPEKYILCYLIGKNEWYEEQLEHIKRISGVEDIVIIASEEYPEFMIDEAIRYDSADPFEFVKLINGAALVCTDSFHATALCINLQKDFIEFIRFFDSDSASQNSRIYDLLSRYSLIDRIYCKEAAGWSKPIDYLSIKTLLEYDRDFSVNFLLNAIDGENVSL